MSDLQIEATQTTRGASTVRSGRATPREAADLTATFDQIFATVAQATRRPTPQATPPSGAPTESLSPVPLLSDVVQPASDDDAISEDSPYHAETPADAVSLIPPSPPNVAVRGDEETLARSIPLTSTRDSEAERNEPGQPATQPRADAAPAPNPIAMARRSLNAQPNGKESALAPHARPAGERKTSQPVRVEPAKPQAQRDEQQLATPLAKVAPKASQSVEGKELPNTQVQDGDAPPLATGAIAGTTTLTDAVPRPAGQREARSERSPRKQPAVRPDAPPPGVTKSHAPARSLPTAPESKSQENGASAPAPREAAPRRSQQPSKSDSTAKAAANAAEKAVAPRTEPTGPAKQAAPAKVDAVNNAEPLKHDGAAVAERNTPPVATTAQARNAEASVAVSVQAEAPTPDRRRLREVRSTATTTIEARAAAQSAPALNKSPEVAPAVSVSPATTTAATAIAAPVVPAPVTNDLPEPVSIKPEPQSLDRKGVNTPPPATSPAPRERTRTAVDDAQSASTKRMPADPQQEVDRVRLIQRVAKALQTAQERGGTLRLRLTPPELGALKIELIVRDGALSARLEAETPAAKSAILENLPALRERLTSQEIKIERLDVDLMQQPDHSDGERRSFADAESSREQAALRRAWRNEKPNATSDVAPTEPAATQQVSMSGLNVLA